MPDTPPPPPPSSSPCAEDLGNASTSSASRRQEAKKCGVCGDRALGYNFNAITCESCKAFFRRNALKNKEFRCPFQNSCTVDQVTRRFCQRCRLRKCFDIGMKKEWIMTEEEKMRKKRKIEENRARKIGETASSSGSQDEEGEESQQERFTLPFGPPTSHVLEAKPHAIVVGVIRGGEGEDLPPAKAMRLEGQADIHQAERVIMHSADYTAPEHHPPHHHHQGVAAPHPLPQELLTELPANSPISESAVADLAQPPSQLGLAQVEEEEEEEEEEEPHHSLADVFAINIKKEVEYQDDLSQPSPYPLRAPLEPHSPHPHPHSTSHSPDQPAQPQEDCAAWVDFNAQEALSILQPDGGQPAAAAAAASGLTVVDSLMNTAIRAEYSPLSLHHSPAAPRELNQAEQLKLSELSEANKGLMAPLCEDYNFKDLTNPSLINIINLTEIAIRRLIKMAKRISAFKSLCQEDQIALLKGGCTEMMILRSVCAYDPDQDSWKIQQDHQRFKDIKLKVLKAAPGNVYEEHKRFILAFAPEWRRDPHIIFLLSAITLFSPLRPNIVHQQAIVHEQCSYLYLTKRYLEGRYGGCEGRTVYHRLLQRLAHLHRLSEEHIRVFLEVNPKQVEPLLIEIFDLKQR